MKIAIVSNEDSEYMKIAIVIVLKIAIVSKVVMVHGQAMISRGHLLTHAEDCQSIEVGQQTRNHLTREGG